MKSFFFSIITFFIICSSLYAAEEAYAERSTELTNKHITESRAKAAAAGTSNAIALSMVTSGVLFALAIGLSVGLLRSGSQTHTHGHSH